MKVKVLVALLCLTLSDHMNCSPVGLFFPGKNTGVDSHFLLQGIFPTQGSNLGLPHCRQILYHLSYQGSSLFSISDAINLASMDAHVQSLQSCLTLCSPIDGSLPGSSVHELLQARILKWVAISFSSPLCTGAESNLRVLGEVEKKCFARQRGT